MSLNYLVLSRLNADRAPQLKATVGHFLLRQGEMTKLLLPLGLILLTACVTKAPLAQAPIPNGWHRVDADGYFTFYLPPSLQFRSDKRCEECSWGSMFADERILLYAEYTSWNEEYAADYLAKQSEYLKTITEIGGKRVKLQSWRTEELFQGFNYLAEARFYDADGKLIARLQAACKERADVNVAKQIFMTVASFKS